jgi:excisionase family DNA binding protein
MQETREIDFRTSERKSVANSSSSSEHFEPLLDSEEAAVLLRIHPKTLQRMARERRITGVKVGKSWRFRVSELNRFVHSKIAS